MEITIHDIMQMTKELTHEQQKEIHDSIMLLVKQEKQAMANSIKSRIDHLISR